MDRPVAGKSRADERQAPRLRRPEVMRGITGVGEKKLAEFGEVFAGEIAAYLEEKV